MVWTGLGCLNYFINGIVWADNVLVPHPIWCDISAKFITGMAVGIPAAALCIQRRLYKIATVSSVTTTKRERRRAVYEDLAIGLGIPFVQMILQVVVQGHRFDVFEEVGCFPTNYPTPLAFVLVYTWPTIIGLISAVYCILTIRQLAKRRSEYNAMLSGAGVNSSRYLRLMALAGIDVICTTPLSAYLSIYENAAFGVNPWLGWADTHWGFNAIGQYPTFVWRANPTFQLSVELSRWSPFICAVVFFAFFGFAQEARKHYKIAFDSVARKVGYTSKGSSTGVSSSFGGGKFSGGISSGGKATLPVFISQRTTTKRDADTNSCISFSTNLDLNDVGGALSDARDIKTLSFNPTDSGPSSFDEDESYEEKASISELPRAITREDAGLGAPPHYDENARPDSQTIELNTHGMV